MDFFRKTRVLIYLPNKKLCLERKKQKERLYYIKLTEARNVRNSLKALTDNPPPDRGEEEVLSPVTKNLPFKTKRKKNVQQS